MISSTSLYQPMDKDMRHRRALADVYEFLLKLAEEKKSLPEVLKPDQKPEEGPAPLKENIPT